MGSVAAIALVRMDLHGQKVSVLTLGCKVNFYDSAKIETAFIDEGCVVVPERDANIVVVNTCTVTKSADYQARQLVRKIRKHNPDCTMVVTGCYAQVAPDAVSKIDQNLIVLGTKEKNDVITYLKERGSGNFSAVGNLRKASTAGDQELLEPAVQTKRTRAFMKIQDGCNAFCSFCIIPFARGKSRSTSESEVLRVIEDLAYKGVKEIVLTGVHVGKYGLDFKEPHAFAQLLRSLQRFPDVRFRLSSMEPAEIDDVVIDALCEATNLCPFLHIPLQSGDDAILERMHRRYTTAHFSELLHRLKQGIPNVCIGTDLIVGFPGEDEAAFERTANYLESVPVDFLHVFPFSRREGTKAHDMPDQVDSHAVKDRARRMRELSREKREQFFRSQIGRELTVLFEGPGKNPGTYRGYTENYIPIEMPSATPLDNLFQRVRLSHISSSGSPIAVFT